MLVIGEALVDIVRRPNGSLDVHPGGSPLNVAVGLARLNHHVTLLTELGNDKHGDLVRLHLAAAGVALQQSRPAPVTSVARATLGTDGSAEYSFEISWTFEGADPAHTAPSHLHTGSLATALEPGAGRIETILQNARSTSSTSYDPNMRPALERDHAEAVARVERFVALADVVKASDEDVAWLYPDRSVETVVRSWAEAGPGIAVITTGGDGAVAATAEGRLVRTAAVSVSVADTVGAGDSFMSALLDRLARSDLLGASHRSQLSAVDGDLLSDVMGWASRAAAITVSRPGADPPTTSEMTGVGRRHSDDAVGIESYASDPYNNQPPRRRQPDSKGSRQ